MVANQSKHTVQFSDLAWEPGSPELPRAWQVGRYLERYQKRYCQAARLRLETTVVSAKPIPTAAGGTSDVKWRVHLRGAQGEELREEFRVPAYRVRILRQAGREALALKPSEGSGDSQQPVPGSP